MLSNNRGKLNSPGKKHELNPEKTLPHLSLNLHIMPQTSDTHLKKWVLWGLLLVLVFVVIAYFLFN